VECELYLTKKLRCRGETIQHCVTEYFVKSLKVIQNDTVE